MGSFAELYLTDLKGTSFAGMSTDDLFAYINNGGGEYRDIHARYCAVLTAYEDPQRDSAPSAIDDPVLKAFFEAAKPIAGRYGEHDYSKWHPLLLRGQYHRAWMSMHDPNYGKNIPQEDRDAFISRMPEMLEILQQHGVEPFRI